MDSNEEVVVESELMWDPVMIQYCYRQKFDSLRFHALRDKRWNNKNIMSDKFNIIYSQKYKISNNSYWIPGTLGTSQDDLGLFGLASNIVIIPSLFPSKIK